MAQLTSLTDRAPRTDDITIGAAHESGLALARLPLDGARIVLRLGDVGVLRALTIAGLDGPTAQAFVVVVNGFSPPSPGWSGRLGRLEGVTALTITWPPRHPGPVIVRLSLAAPATVALVAAAVLPLVVPSPAWRGAGSPLVAVAPRTPLAALALLPETGARAARSEPNPEALLGNDIVIAPVAALTADVQVSHLITVGSTGAPGHAGRTRAPLVDLHLHRPVGRVTSVTTETAGRLASLDTDGDGWTMRSADDGAATHLAADRPLDLPAVRGLRGVRAIDLGGLPVPAGTAGQVRLAARLAEVAATGAVLYSGGHLGPVLARLAPELARQIGDRHLPALGLSTTLRSVRQRRGAMRAHGGFFRLDDVVRASGYSPLLPSVTAVLVTNRTERVAEALRQLAAQSYPRLEVVVALHGAQAPDLSGESEAVRDLVSRTIELSSEVPFGEALAVATRAADGDLVTKVDDDDLYGPEHVWDLVLAYLYSGAQVVGKQPEYVYLQQLDVTVHRAFATETYVRAVAGGTMLMSVADLASVGGWRGVPRSVDRGLLQRVVEAGGLIYATHGLGFIYVRHDEGHTWSAQTSSFLRRTTEQWTGRHTAILDA